MDHRPSCKHVGDHTEMYVVWYRWTTLGIRTILIDFYVQNVMSDNMWVPRESNNN